VLSFVVLWPQKEEEDEEEGRREEKKQRGGALKPHVASVVEGELTTSEIGIVVAGLEELLVRSTGDDAALHEDKDGVCVADCGETMSNAEGSAVVHQTIESLLDELFALCIKGTRCLIEKEDSGVGEDGTCNGDALLLTS